MSSGIYNTWKGKDGNDWASGADSAYKWMLVTGSYTPDPDHAHPNATGLASNEVTGGSYARQNVASRTKAEDDSTDTFTHSANNPTFTALSAAQPRYAVCYRVVTNDTDHQLVAWLDLGASLNITGDFLVKLNGTTTTGIVFKGA